MACNSLCHETVLDIVRFLVRKQKHLDRLSIAMRVFAVLLDHQSGFAHQASTNRVNQAQDFWGAFTTLRGIARSAVYDTLQSCNQVVGIDALGTTECLHDFSITIKISRSQDTQGNQDTADSKKHGLLDQRIVGVPAAEEFDKKCPETESEVVSTDGNYRNLFRRPAVTTSSDSQRQQIRLFRVVKIFFWLFFFFNFRSFI